MDGWGIQTYIVERDDRTKVMERKKERWGMHERKEKLMSKDL